MTFRSNAATHVGMVRKLNEDSMLELPQVGVWVVADGMGGHSAGDFASQTIIRLINQLEPSDDFEGLLQNVKQKILDANRFLLEQHADVDQSRTPGSTVVALIISGDSGAVVWAGDSRIYRLRDGEIRQLSRDHSHVQDLVDQNMIDEDAAESHPMANVITRAVGIFHDLELDSVRIDIREGDRFILCSDGLSRLASCAEIQEVLERSDMTEREMVDTLISMSLDRGAPDNVTIIFVHDSDMEEWTEETNETNVMDLPTFDS